MRQSERGRAYPRADEVIVEMSAFGETGDAFYIVIPNDLAPLEFSVRFVKSDHWLHSLVGPRHRLVLWENLRRLAEALGAAHGQGLVHGRIDARAVYTAGSTTKADFRLGGFEFCLRVAELHKAPLTIIARSRPAGAVIFSFIDDWRALGRVVADLLGLDHNKFDEEEVPFLTGRPVLDLRPSEIDLVRSLLEPERNQALDAQTVIEQVDSVVAELEAEALSDNGRYVIALRLGDVSRLSKTLNAASGDAFDTDDTDAQIDFVRADIETGADLVRTARGDLILMTEAIAYDLRPFSVAGSEETWNIATCNNGRLREDVHLGRRQTMAIAPHRIEIVRFGAAQDRLKQLRSDALNWSAAFGLLSEGDPTVAVRRGLLLAQVAEALFKAVEIAPVEVVSQRVHGGKRIVEVTASDDEARMRLAEALHVDDPHRLLRRLFEREEADFDAEWQLVETAGLGTTPRGGANVRFARVVHKHNRRVYEFVVTDGVMPATNQLHLRKVDDTGTEQVLRRRLRVLGALATQSELALSLADPHARMRAYRDEPLTEDSKFAELDPSKQEALRSVWSTGPNQFVVGPPGVGKTKLVTEIVRRTLSTTTRLLLSAQAHQALDNLAAEVQKEVRKAGLDDVILVRSRADSGAELSGAQTPDRAKAYLAQLGDSSLVRRAPTAIRQSLIEMTAAAEVTGNLRAKLPLPTLRQRRSFEALVLQSANILFSTTNSADLERLIEDRAQFDWIIVEEAAKATGPELLAPLFLSMRRLLIGDHNQLPPFDTDRIDDFLADQTRVKRALAESDPVVGSIFRDFGLDDLREALEDDDVLSQTCATSRRMLLLFESLVKTELDRQERLGGGRRRTSTELLQQHRMHPVIATLISECFYDCKLKTYPKRAFEFERGPAPFSITDPRLPASPIVFVDLPYVQRESGAGERQPTYHNPAELRAALGVLEMIRAAPTDPVNPPSLAILSPYNEQVDRLGRAIDDGLAGGLAHLSEFARGTNATGFESTVDSFQGGEADIVFVSLVRNNDHFGRRALGIVRDRRRMNVLLSRAKWKLVIIGSLEFLRVQSRRYRRHRAGTRAMPVFLARMLEVFDRLECETMPDGRTKKFSAVPWSTLSERVEP